MYSLLVSSMAFSRQVEDWPYERLFKESDLVVIAHVQGRGVTKKEWDEKFFDKGRFGTRNKPGWKSKLLVLAQE